jgi:hypothetical protein
MLDYKRLTATCQYMIASGVGARPVFPSPPAHEGVGARRAPLRIHAWSGYAATWAPTRRRDSTICQSMFEKKASMYFAFSDGL